MDISYSSEMMMASGEESTLICNPNDQTATQTTRQQPKILIYSYGLIAVMGTESTVKYYYKKTLNFYSEYDFQKHSVRQIPTIHSLEIYISRQSRLRIRQQFILYHPHHLSK